MISEPSDNIVQMSIDVQSCCVVWPLQVFLACLAYRPQHKFLESSLQLILMCSFGGAACVFCCIFFQKVFGIE